MRTKKRNAAVATNVFPAIIDAIWKREERSGMSYSRDMLWMKLEKLVMLNHLSDS